MNNTSRSFITKSAFIWWLGWLSLGLVEGALRFTIYTPVVRLMLLFTLLLYSLVGVTSGSLFAVITLDTTRADHISCYGYQRLTTPNVDKLAREGEAAKINKSTEERLHALGYIR